MTFLFAEVVDSWAIWERFPREAGVALARHEGLVRTVIAEHHGLVFSADADRLGAAFADANDAASAACGVVRSVHADSTRPAAEVRIGLHTGSAEQRESGYFGAAVNRAARVAAAAHGGQVIMTSVTAALVAAGERTISDAGAHRLRGLDRREHLYRLHAVGMPTVDLAVTSNHRDGNLPHRRAALIGRERELAHLADLIAPGGLVTVTGPPGVGKTSLALVAAHRAAADHADGGWLVELAAATTPHDVVSVVVTALGLFVATGDVTAEAIAEVIGGQERLIVLDNCEHVIGAVNELVDVVLARCPHVALLATSRELLGCDGERLLTVAPLSVQTDAGRSDAGRLFVERLARVGTAIGPADVDDDLIEDVCRRLDGVPLALELAAARAGTVGVREVGARLATNTFDLGRRGAGPDRHRSLTNVVAWSYELLSPDDQRVLERLALFADGFDLAAADAVCAFGPVSGPIDEHVFSLLDKSLVTVQRSMPVRYRLLEVVRQFCERRLSMRGELDQVGGRLVAHYVDWSARADAGVRGPDEQRWHVAFAAEWNNLRAVTKRAMAAGDLDAACRLVWHARWWAALRDRLEVGDWADAVLAVPGAEAHPLSPLLMSAGAEIARRRLKWGQYRARQAASAQLEQALGDAPEPWVPYTRFFLEAFSLDVEPLPCSIELEQRVGGSPFWAVAAAWCRAFMPSTRLSVGARAASSEYDWQRVQDFVQAAEALDNPTWMARSSHLLGSALRASDPAQAVTILEGGLAAAQSVGNGVAHAELCNDLAGAYAETGRPLDSVELILDGIAAYRRVGAWFHVRSMILASFRALVGLERFGPACVVAAEALKGDWTDDWIEYMVPGHLMARVREALGAAEVDRLIAARRHRSVASAIAEVEPVLVELREAATTRDIAEA